MKPIYVVDVMRDVVSNVSTKLTAGFKEIDSKIDAVHYEHGHPVEIINKLNEKNEVQEFKFKRYPLVALFQDFPEKVSDKSGIQFEVSLHLIIARITDNDYDATKRYTENFKPFLYPIYFELLNQIHLSSFGRWKPFLTKAPELIEHTKIDRLYWGKEGLYANEGNVFNDFIDCIEIKDLKLLINIKNC